MTGSRTLSLACGLTTINKKIKILAREIWYEIISSQILRETIKIIKVMSSYRFLMSGKQAS